MWIGVVNGSELLDGRESLFAAFMNVSGVLINAQFIVQGDTKVCVTLHHLDCFTTCADRVVCVGLGVDLFGVLKTGAFVFETFNCRCLCVHHCVR